MDQDLLCCEECWKCFAGQCETCPVHGAVHHIPDSLVPSRAFSSAPSVISIRRLDPDSHGQTIHGAFVSSLIESRTAFGPIEGPLVSAPSSLSQDQFLLKKFRAGVELGCIDVTNEDLCNWLIFIRPARNYAEQNMLAYQYQDDIYFLTTKDIPTHSELRVWYAKDYATLMGLSIYQAEDLNADCGPPNDNAAVSVIKFSSLHSSPEEISFDNNRANRRKASRPQRVPQSSLDDGEPTLPVDPPPLPVPIRIKQQQPELSLQPPPCINSNDIFLIYENSSNGLNGLQGGSLLLVTPNAPILRNQSFGGISQTSSTLAWRNNSFLANSAQNPVTLSSSDESMVSGDTVKSPNSPSMDSENDDDGSRIHGTMQHSGGGGRPYSCSYPACSKFFSSKYKLLRHELIHSQEKRHHCALCHKKFHRKDHLNNHLKVHERSKVRLECMLCGCIFAKKWTYEKHLALHDRDQSGNPFSPGQQQLLAGEAGVDDGRESGEDDEEKEEDDSLWQSMHQQQQRELEEAEEEMEAVEEPTLVYPTAPPTVKKPSLNQKPSHPCEVCGKVFSASKDLRRHVQTHLGIKPNLCPYCPKKFTRKDHVRRHITTVHADCHDALPGGRKLAHILPLSSMGDNDIQLMVQ